MKGTAFYVAGIIVIGVISAAFSNWRPRWC